MPLYEYQCSACGHRFEVIQKFSDKPVKKCPQCGKAVERLVSSPAIQFKGTGWYITDYARKGMSNPDAKGESKSEKESPKETAPTGSEKNDKPKEKAATPPASAATK